MTAFSVPANLAFDSYTALVAGIGDWLDREDLTGSAGGMIALAEAKMRRELCPLFPERTASIAATDGVGSLPDDFSTPRTVSTTCGPLPQIGPSQGLLIESGPNPVAWSLEAEMLRLWPAVTATVTLLYEPTLPQLTETTPSNFLLDRMPDLYFFGAMMFAEGYLANDQRASLFKALFDEALDSARRFFTRQRFAGPLKPQVAFVP